MKILLYSGCSNFLLHSHPSCAAITVTAMTALFPFPLYLVAIIYFTHVCVSVTNLCIHSHVVIQAFAAISDQSKPSETPEPLQRPSSTRKSSWALTSHSKAMLPFYFIFLFPSKKNKSILEF